MKKISDQEVIDTYRKKNRSKHLKETAAALKDDDLFAVNVDKDGLSQKREKLAADRFKRKNTEGNLRSKTEVNLMKKLSKKGPAEPVKQESEFFDVWGDANSVTGWSAPSKKVQKFRQFSDRSMTKVKSVVMPAGGQSVNPALNAH